MNIQLLLMILGIIATIIIGIWGVTYASKQRIKSKLLFFVNNCVSLFKSIVKDVDEIEIKYKNKIVDENLILFKGTFFNAGNTDIDKRIIHKPLTIELHKCFTWAKVKIIDKSKDVLIEEEFYENNLVLNWDILKENEYFTFDSIIEYKPDSKNEKENDEKLTEDDITRLLLRNLKFTHRITNLKSVDKEELPSKPMSFWGITFASLYLLFFVGLFLRFSVGQFIFPKYSLYHEVHQDSTISLVKLKLIDKDKIELLSNKNEKSMVSGKILSEILDKRVEITKQKISYWALILAGLFAILFSIVFIFFIREYIRHKKLYKKIKIIVDKHSNIQLTSYGRRRPHLLPFRFD